MKRKPEALVGKDRKTFKSGRQFKKNEEETVQKKKKKSLRKKGGGMEEGGLTGERGRCR